MPCFVFFSFLDFSVIQFWVRGRRGWGRDEKCVDGCGSRWHTKCKFLVTFFSSIANDWSRLGHRTKHQHAKDFLSLTSRRKREKFCLEFCNVIIWLALKGLPLNSLEARQVRKMALHTKTSLGLAFHACQETFTFQKVPLEFEHQQSNSKSMAYWTVITSRW